VLFIVCYLLAGVHHHRSVSIYVYLRANRPSVTRTAVLSWVKVDVGSYPDLFNCVSVHIRVFGFRLPLWFIQCIF